MCANFSVGLCFEFVLFQKCFCFKRNSSKYCKYCSMMVLCTRVGKVESIFKTTRLKGQIISSMI